MKKIIIALTLFFSFSLFAQKPKVDYIMFAKYTTEKRDAIDVSDTSVLYFIENTDVDSLQVNRGSGWINLFPAFTTPTLQQVTDEGSTSTNSITVTSSGTTKGVYASDINRSASITSKGYVGAQDTSGTFQGIGLNISNRGLQYHNGNNVTAVRAVDPTQNNDIFFKNSSGTVAFISDLFTPTDLATDYGVNLSTVATTNSYDDLDDLPTALSQFTNDVPFLTSADLNGLEKRTVSDGFGFRFRDAESWGGNYGSLGKYSIDLSIDNNSEGSGSGAVGNNSVAIGFGIIADANETVGIGSGVDVGGIGGIGVGSGVYVSSTESTAVGYYSSAYNGGSSAFGTTSYAFGAYSTAIGGETKAYATFSTALGHNTIARNTGEIALGAFNVDSEDSNVTTGTGRLLTIGNGLSTGARSDALRMIRNGVITLPNTTIANLNASGTGKEIPTIEWVEAQGYGSGSPTTDASDLTSGVLANARVQESNVTQHETALTIDVAQLTGMSAYLTTANAASTYQPILSEGAFVDGDKTKLDALEVGISSTRITANYALDPDDDLIFADNDSEITITIDTDANSGFTQNKIYTFVFKKDAAKVNFDFLAGVGGGSDFSTYLNTTSVSIMRIGADDWQVLNLPNIYESFDYAGYDQATEPTLSTTAVPNTASFVANKEMLLTTFQFNGVDYHYWVQLEE